MPGQNSRSWLSRIRDAGSGTPDPGRKLVSAGLDLFDGVVDQAFVVRLGHVPLQDLRRDHHRQVDRFVPDLLERAARLELNLALRRLATARLGFSPWPFSRISLAQPLRRRDAPRRSAPPLRRARLCSFAAYSFSLASASSRIALGLGQRAVDELLALLEQAEDRSPRELAEHDDDDHEDDQCPDGVAEIAGERA